MGRLAKKGLDYFNIDCDQEDNLTMIEAKHKIAGYGVVVKLWKKCYQIQGYYAEWEEKNIYLFAKDTGVEIEFLKAVVETCFEENIFSRSMYKKYKVLTSHGIQKRWKDIVVAAKRKDVEVDAKYLLESFNPYKPSFTPEEIPENSGTNAIKEVKESKVKENNTGAPSAPSDPGVKEKSKGKGKTMPPTFQQATDYFLATIGDTTRPLHWPEDKCRNQAAQFFDHYTANGWVQGRGKPIKDWQAAVRNWIRRALQAVFEKPKAPEKERPAVARIEDPPSKLNAVQLELNYLYGRWLEKADHVTVISTTIDQYNFLKSHHLITFSDDEIKEIRRLTFEHMQEKKLEGATAETRLMKAYGVLAFFAQLKSKSQKIVFDE